MALALGLLAAAIYGQSVGFESLDFDDQEYVYANPEVLAGLTPHGLAWAMTAFHSANWHPVTWISHMVDVELFGARPGPHHGVNVLLHAANSALLFIALDTVTAAFWPSAFVAALFCAHPLNVENVAWISQRKALLATLFFFAAIRAYVIWAKRKGPSIGWKPALLVALGLLCKPTLATAPLLLLALDSWPLARAGSGLRIRQLLAEKIPYAALAAGSSLATLLAQSSWGAVGSSDGFPLGERIANALVSPVAYLRDALWPANLACFYPHPATLGARTGLLPAAAASVLLLGITVLAVRSRRSRPWLLFGWIWYLFALLPVLGLVQVGSQARADRYTYLPMVGIFVACVWEAVAWCRPGKLPARLVAAVGVLVIGALGARAYLLARAWRDGESLNAHALAVTRDNWLAANNLGMVWLARDDPQRALVAFREAVRMKPDYGEAYYNAGVALGALARPLEAVEAYREALRLAPENTDGWVNLGLALLALGRVPEALQACETALAQRPDDPLALQGAGAARAALDQRAVALEYLARLQQVDPARAAELRHALGSAR